jgi:uncharacterized protein (TIGR00369 family)
MRLPFPKQPKAKTNDPTSDPTSVHWIRTLWDKLAPIPGGNLIFSRLLGMRIPYTGSIRADVLRLGPGYASLQLKDRPSLRNHVQSLHAVALCNLAELTGNAALAYDLPPDARFIVTELTMRYLRKARGTISARCQCQPVTSNERRAYTLEVQLFDAQDELVATATMQTLVGPIKPS